MNTVLPPAWASPLYPRVIPQTVSAVTAQPTTSNDKLYLVVPNPTQNAFGFRLPEWARPPYKQVQKMTATPAAVPALPKETAVTVPTIAEYTQQQSATAPVATTTTAQPISQTATTPAATTAPAPQANVINATFTGNQEPIRLHSTSVPQHHLPTYGINVLDYPDAAVSGANQYWAAVKNGQIPVLSDADQAADNRLFARNQLALSAATNAADANATYRAMNNPGTRQLAVDIMKQNGISFDLALKMALQGQLEQQGNYALANRYEIGTVLPAIEMENQQRSAIANETGSDNPAITDSFGNEIYTRSSPTSLYQLEDGTVQVNTPSQRLELTAPATADLSALMTSTTPAVQAQQLRQANSQLQITQAQNKQAQVASQVKATADAHDQVRKQIAEQTKARLTALANQQNYNYKTAALNARYPNGANGTTAPQAKPYNNEQKLRAVVEAAKLYPEGSPERNAIINKAFQEYGIDVRQIMTDGLF